MRELNANDIATLDLVTGGIDVSGEIPWYAWSLTSNPAFARGFFQNVMVVNYGWTNNDNNFNTFMQGAAGAAAGGYTGGVAGAVAGAIAGAASSGTFYA